MHPEDGTLARGGERVHLGPRQMDLLLVLANHGGRIVSKEALFGAVWSGVEVEEVALPRCVSEIRKALGDDVREPRYIQTVARRGYRLIAPLGPLPEARGPSRWTGTAAVATGVIAGAVLAAIAALVIMHRAGSDAGSAARADRTATASLPDANARRSIAVLALRDLTADPETAWLETALSEMLATELALAKGLRVVPGDTVARAERELAAPAAAAVSARLDRLQAVLGTDLLVHGSYLQIEAERGDRLRLDLRVLDAASGETAAALVESGPVDDLFDLVSLIGSRLRERLGFGGPAGTERHEMRAYLPPDPLATRLYFEGLQRLRRFEARSAGELLERSLARHPEQPFALLALSEAWSTLGNEARAREAADRARDLAADMPHEHRLRIDARHLEAHARWRDAVDHFRALWLLEPDDPELGLELAGAEAAAGRPREALATLEEIQARAGPRYRDPRLDLAVARCARALGDHERALAAADRAIELADELDAGLLAARGRHTRAHSLYALGRADQAKATLAAARAAFAAAGDRASEAASRRTLAAWLANHGDFERAEELARSALGVFREIGDRAGEAGTLGLVAALTSEKGDLAGAEEILRQRLDIYRQLGSRGGEAASLNRLAVALASHGRREEAGVLFEQTLALYRELENEELVAVTSMNLGKLRLLEGKVAEAAARLRQAAASMEPLGLEERLANVRFNLGYAELKAGELAVAETAFADAVARFRSLGNRRMLSASLEGLADALAEQGDLAAAREHLETSISLRVAMGEPARIARGRAVLARVLLAAGDPVAAERMARRAMGDAETIADCPIEAVGALSLALLDQGKATEAGAFMARVAPGWQPGPATGINGLWLAVISARTRAATGDGVAAVAELRMVADRAARGGAAMLEARAQLALDEIGATLPGAPAARARLAALEAEARARGWALIADRARTALRALDPQPLLAGGVDPSGRR